MIEITEEFVEPVHRGQELVPIAQMVLAKLPSRVAHRFQHGSDGRRLIRHADRGPGLPDRGEPGADRQLASDEVGTAGRAARFGVIVGEHHSFGSQLIEVRRPAGHDTPVIRADVEPTDVVTHDEDNIWFLLLLLCGGGNARYRGGGTQHHKSGPEYSELAHDCSPECG